MTKNTTKRKISVVNAWIDYEKYRFRITYGQQELENLMLDQSIHLELVAFC